jgi:hypothetical protein
MNDTVVVKTDPGNPSIKYVSTTSDTALRITKEEAWGGYAHGVAYWLSSGVRAEVLYSNGGDGSVDLPVFKAHTTVKVQLYRIIIFFLDPIDPLYRVDTQKDTAGPTFAVTPEPGAYTGTTVSAAVSDAGVGMPADMDMVTEYNVRLASTGEIVASGHGTQVTLDAEGIYHLVFSASDLLGNTASGPPDNANVYTIDRSSPVLSDVTGAVQVRSDGSLDFSSQFLLSDQGVGVAQPTLTVGVTDQDGSSWSFGAGDLVILPQAGGTIAVSLPGLIVPRSARLLLHVIAEDMIGNTLDDSGHSLAMPPDPLVASLLAAGVTAEVVQDGYSLVPRYRIPISLDRPRIELLSAGVARYRLTRRIGSSGIIEAAADLTPDELVSALVDQGGYAVFSDVVQGNGYAHQSLTYTIETVFSVPGSETILVTGSAEMPNIEAWQVELSAGETSLQVYRSGLLQYPEVRIRSFEGVTARISTDPEGDALAMQLEYTGPGGISGSVPVDSWTQQVMLTEAILEAPDGVYQVRYTVSEAGNSRTQTSAWCVIKVDRNYGEIAGDFTWDTDQVMSGSVVIMGGARLRIADGVRISVVDSVDPVTGGPLTITVRPGGTLTLAPGCSIQPARWDAGTQAGNGWQYWGGIMAEGTLNVISASIRGAIRGITAVSGSSVTLQGALLERCRTGVHALGAGADPVIVATLFLANARYGIKEDDGASPVVTNCLFDANTYDYYDEALTVVDSEDIDNLPPGANFGNESSRSSP